jgi:hypothetical protein
VIRLAVFADQDDLDMVMPTMGEEWIGIVVGAEVNGQAFDEALFFDPFSRKSVAEAKGVFDWICNVVLTRLKPGSPSSFA